MSVFVLGSGGQLARHLSQTLADAEFHSRPECNLEDTATVKAVILDAAPDVIVNAAAYTAVDGAEDEPALAWRVNAEGAAAVASAAAALDTPLIHVSTDYVFDGESEQPYRSSDAPNPINTYGKTKLAGELAVTSLSRRHWIIRSSWIFSEFDGNFVTTMIRLANDRDEIRVVADQYGRPTYAGDLAQVIATLASGTSDAPVPWGTYHLSGGEATSWYGFAQDIIARGYEEGLIGHEPRIQAIPTADYPVRARRPMNSVLEPTGILHRALVSEPDWHKGLDKVLKRLRSAM